MQRFWLGLLTGIFLVAVFVGGAASERLWGLPLLNKLTNQQTNERTERLNQRILTEENVVT
ncbi:MAG: hypothetical protein AAB802_02285, partial [Patescibacteria group bacterium]